MHASLTPFQQQAPLTRRQLGCWRAQRTPDLALRHGKLAGESHVGDASYPTDAKEREKVKKNLLKEKGIEHNVVKRKKIMEDHYDDCGDDLKSLDDVAYLGETQPCQFDSEEELADQEHKHGLLSSNPTSLSYFVDVSKVAKAQRGSTPAPGVDPRAPLKKDSTCPGCKHFRARSDWEHTREVGQCSYPYDEPWIPDCEACQDRKPRDHYDHSLEEGTSRWATAQFRKRRASRPHEPQPTAHEEPTAGLPGTKDGKELGQEGEEKVIEEEQRINPQRPNRRQQ